MTIILPYNSNINQIFYLFGNTDKIEDVTYDFLVYKDDELLYTCTVEGAQETSRFYKFSRVKTEILGGYSNNLPIEDEGWYNWNLLYDGDVLDEGQLFIGEYNYVDSEDVYYEK